MRHALSLFSFLLVLFPAFSQNLVLNPSFEQLKPQGVVVACEFMLESGRFPQCIETWTSFYGMTPDILRAADNCPMLTQVHSGELCAGIIYYLPAEDVTQRGGYREAIQGQLMRPLRPGIRYRVEVWVREDSTMMHNHLKKVYTPKTPVVPVQAGNLGFCFSVKPYDSRQYLQQFMSDLNLKPQINFSEVIATRGQWVKLSTTFVPDQPFQYFTIGNFLDDAKTANGLSLRRHRQIDSLNNKLPSPMDKIKRVAYLCLDDVSISPESPPAVDTTAMSLETRMLKEKKFTFNAGVLFDSGKADLRRAAGPDLDSLAAFLRKYPRVRIGISGHTDNVGTEEYNLDLSTRRAQSVHGCLLAQGIPAAQIEWKAFGETRPVADNETEEGRQRNRRVECVVLK